MIAPFGVQPTVTLVPSLTQLDISTTSIQNCPLALTHLVLLAPHEAKRLLLTSRCWDWKLKTCTKSFRVVPGTPKRPKTPIHHRACLSAADLLAWTEPDIAGKTNILVGPGRPSTMITPAVVYTVNGRTPRKKKRSGDNV